MTRSQKQYLGASLTWGGCLRGNMGDSLPGVWNTTNDRYMDGLQEADRDFHSVLDRTSPQRSAAMAG